MTSTASVTTDRPARHGGQLVSRLARRVEGAWEEGAGTGWLDAGTWRAAPTAAEGALDLETVSDADEVGRAEDVVGRHLVRFGARDELVVRWTRSGGAPGTVQGATGG